MQTSKYGDVISAFAITVALGATSGVVHAASYPLFSHDHQFLLPEAVPATGAGVTYYGGPVLSHVKVVPVFWGPDVTAETKANIGTFYKTIVNSNYLDWLDEYNTDTKAQDGRDGTKQRIGRGTAYDPITITPGNQSAKLDQAGIEAELLKQIDAGILPKPDADSLYMVHFAPSVAINISWGESCQVWCADHEALSSPKYGAVAYAMMPECSLGCGSGTPFDAITWAASHELAEAITDPVCPLANAPTQYPAAWLRSDGQEIGDLCNGTDAQLSGSSKIFTVQAEWNNTTSGCYAGPFASP